MQSQSEQSTRIIRETIIREQLTRLFPNVGKVDLLFCAHKLTIQIHGFRYDPDFDGGKC